MRYYFRAFIPHDLNAVPEDARPHLCSDSRGITGIKVTDDGLEVISAVAVLDSWMVNSCVIHVTILDPLALRHGFHKEVFNYVFNTCNRSVLLGATPADNLKALKFNEHIGFREIYRVKDGNAPGIDLVLTEYRKEHCRWLTDDRSLEHGKEIHTESA